LAKRRRAGQPLATKCRKLVTLDPACHAERA
jgi:hypothetical protein